MSGRFATEQAAWDAHSGIQREKGDLKVSRIGETDYSLSAKERVLIIYPCHLPHFTQAIHSELSDYWSIWSEVLGEIGCGPTEEEAWNDVIRNRSSLSKPSA